MDVEDVVGKKVFIVVNVLLIEVNGIKSYGEYIVYRCEFLIILVFYNFRFIFVVIFFVGVVFIGFNYDFILMLCSFKVILLGFG